MLSSLISARMASFLRARDKHLRFAAFRLFRMCLKVNNGNFMIHLMKLDVFNPMLDLTIQESRRDSLLSAPCQEFFERMRCGASKLPVPSTRLGDKRRREDDDDEQLDLLATEPKRPDLGPRKEPEPPLSPSKRDTRLSSRRSMSTITEGSTDESGVHRDVVSLEVGDEVYAFDKYTPRGNQADGIWYRGYVVCTARLPPVTWSTSSDPTSSSSAKPIKNEEPQQVFIGIFPASHIFVRDELSDAEGRLPDLVTSFTAGSSNHNGSVTSADYLAQWERERANSGPEPPREHRERDRAGGRHSHRR